MVSRQMFRRAIGTCAALTVTVLIGVWLVLAWFGIRLEGPFRYPECSQVVQAVQNETLSPDPAGILTLPPRLSRASYNGKAYVTGDPHGWLMVFFPAAAEPMATYQGYLFSNKRLSSGDTIFIRAPLISGLVPAVVGELEGANWYHVSIVYE